MRLILASVIAATAAVAGAPRPATACSPWHNDAYIVDARDGTDVRPPTAVGAMMRFEAWHDPPDCPGSIGMLSIGAGAEDDHSGADVGFIVDAPDGLFVWGDGWKDVPGLYGQLVYYTRSDEVPFDLLISAVDRAGNVGPATRFTVSEVEYQDSAGCSAGGGGGGGALVMLALGGLARRRPRADVAAA